MKRLYAIVFLMIARPVLSHSQETPKLYADLAASYEQQDYQACVNQEKEITTFVASHRDTLGANAINFLGESFYQTGNPQKALEWYEKEYALRTDLGLVKTDAYSVNLYNLANTYLEVGNYTKAGAMATQLIQNDRKLYEPSSEDFVASVLTAVNIYSQLDQFSLAEKLLEKTIKEQEAGSMFQGILLTKIGDLFIQTSQYSKAAKALNSALTILEKSVGKESDEYTSATTTLAILYMSQGKFGDAEEAFDVTLSKLTDADEAYVATLNNQAIVYQNLGQFERSEKAFKEVLKIEGAALGTDHPQYAVTLTNIGLVYADEGKYKDAEQALTQALEIQRKSNEAKTVSYARKLNNLAKVYRMAGAPDKAIPHHEEALAIFKSKLGEKSAEYATTAYNLGIANWKAGKGQIGLKYLKSSAAIRAERLGKKHPKYAESIQKIAEYQWEQKQLKGAKVSFNEVFENYYFQIDKSFPVLTEEEKAKFYYNNIKPSFEKFNSFAMEARNSDPTIIGEVFNHHINSKAAIMYATEKVKESIAKSSDTTLIREFEVWQSQKEQIAKLYSQNQPSNKIDSLQQSADRLEKDLTRRSAVFAKELIKKKFTWQEVQSKLQKDEAAIEVIRYKTYSPKLAGNFNDAVVYAFLIVTKETKNQPEVVLVENGKDLENKYLNYYRNNIKFNLEDSRSYQLFFESLSNHLQKKGIKKIYFSPDGVYNQININTVKNPATQKFLLDEYEVRLVTNTRELLDQKTSKANSQSSLLIGYPKFNLKGQVPVSPEASTRSLTKDGNLSRGLRGGLLRQLRGEGGISVLPGTEVEINQIAKVTREPEIFMEENAAEGLIKQVISPMILHVATHGYFLEEDQSTSNPEEGKNNFVPSPLLQSGLLLAGSEDFLKFGTPANDDGDDGILTAYEAMNLKLDDTELVVLSACETGLGVVKNGEGVYGLQRAFKMAGAKTMIMSLWQVDDAATQQLMSGFYEEKLKNQDIHAAFRIAQQKLKEKYPHPFFWGAFIMVGI